MLKKNQYIGFENEYSILKYVDIFIHPFYLMICLKSVLSFKNIYAQLFSL